MRVYLHGSEGYPPVALHVIYVTPAADMNGKEEAPADWVDNKNNPKSFEIEFHHGTAEVEQRLGRYLVEKGLAHRTRLVLPEYFGAA